jgi:hypothetical protein
MYNIFGYFMTVNGQMMVTVCIFFIVPVVLGGKKIKTKIRN